MTIFIDPVVFEVFFLVFRCSTFQSFKGPIHHPALHSTRDHPSALQTATINSPALKGANQNCECCVQRAGCSAVVDSSRSPSTSAV